MKYKCNRCGEQTPGEDMNYRDGEKVCDSCLDLDEMPTAGVKVKCGGCGATHDEDYINRMEGFPPMCDGCIKMSFTALDLEDTIPVGKYDTFKNLLTAFAVNV